MRVMFLDVSICLIFIPYIVGRVLGLLYWMLIAEKESGKKHSRCWKNFAPENEASKALFQSMGYRVAGVMKQWNFSKNTYHDEVMVQKIYND